MESLQLSSYHILLYMVLNGNEKSFLRNVTCNLLPCHLRQQNEQRKDAQKVSLSQIKRMTIMNALHRSIVFNKINKSINLLTWIEKERGRHEKSYYEKCLLFDLTQFIAVDRAWFSQKKNRANTTTTPFLSQLRNPKNSRLSCSFCSNGWWVVWWYWNDIN